MPQNPWISNIAQQVDKFVANNKGDINCVINITARDLRRLIDFARQGISELQNNDTPDPEEPTTTHNPWEKKAEANGALGQNFFTK